MHYRPWLVWFILHQRESDTEKGEVYYVHSASLALENGVVFPFGPFAARQCIRDAPVIVEHLEALIVWP